MIDEVAPALPADKPRYLMGVGTPEDLLEAVARGIDMFDCMMPTRNGRHGLAFTRRGTINLRNARHADDPRPLDEASARGDAHLFARLPASSVRANEMLGAMLLSEINLAYYQELMAGMRDAIASEVSRVSGLLHARHGREAIYRFDREPSVMYARGSVSLNQELAFSLSTRCHGHALRPFGPGRRP